MRRILIGLNIVIAFFLATPAVALAATLKLSPASATFNKGCPATIQILVDTEGASTDGTDAILFYPSQVFSASTANIQTNTAVYPEFPGNSVDSTGGKVTVSGLASSTNPYKGSGVLATINFTVPATAPTGTAQVKFDFDANDKTKTVDSNVVEHSTIADLLSSVTDGNYTIGSGACGTTTTAPTTAPIVYVQPGQGFQGTPSAYSPSPALEYKKLAVTADTNPTMIVGILGTILVIAGIIGVAVL